jgi:antitoxin HigA-1
MAIKREDVSKVDLSDVTTGKRLPSVHPGTILRTEFLEPMDISVYELAKALKVPRSRVNDIVRGSRAITADTALRLSRYFGTSPELWVNLQAQYDLEIAQRTARRRIEREVHPRQAA